MRVRPEHAGSGPMWTPRSSDASDTAGAAGSDRSISSWSDDSRRRCCLCRDSTSHRDEREADEFNYLPRVHQPTLMMSGRYDDVFPLQTAVFPFVQGLGVPPADKRHRIYRT